MLAYEVEKEKNIIRNLHQLLRAKLTGEEWRKFDRQKLDRDRVKFLYDLKRMDIEACLEKNFYLHTVTKDKLKAMVLKNSGNKAFREGHTENALKLYSECLVWMPHDDSKDAAIVYANRCACLFHLGQYNLALQDAEIAFTLDYPAELQYKLYERAGRCCLMLGKTKESTKRFQLALKAIDNVAGMDGSKAEKLRSHLEDLVRSNTFHSSPYTTPEEKRVKLPEVVGGRGKYLQNASKRCAMQRSDTEGRFIIANEDIHPGDVLFVEKAYVSTLDQDFCHRQCAQCFAPLKAPIVCNNCVVASYCSPNCKDASWNSHHKYECQILDFLHSSAVSVICYLAIRILTQHPNPVDILSWFDSINDTENEELSKKEITESNGKSAEIEVSEAVVGEYYRTDHTALFSHVTHSEKRNTEENFHRAVMTLFLMYTLKKTKLFKTIFEQKSSGNENGKRKGSQKLTEEAIEVKLATVIFRCLKFLQFNTYALTAWDTDKKKSVSVGGGVFNTLTLCNHSCAPAVSRYFVDDTIIVRAIRTIYKGEQISGNYGPLYATSRKQDRQSTLMNVFWFQCQCEACAQNWPTFEEMTKQDTVSFRCVFCRNLICQSDDESMNFLTPCSNCLQLTNILKSLKLMSEVEGNYKKISALIDGGKFEKALEIIFKSLSQLDSVVLPPFKNYHIWQETARICFLQFGNKVYPPVSDVCLIRRTKK